jgi:hypothetical protein
MRIVNLEQFLAMPPGTLFAKYAPQSFGKLRVKGESIPEASDFFFRPLWNVEAGNSQELYAAIRDGEEQGADIEITVECEERDGIFYYQQLYAVFRDDETRRIAGALPRWISVKERLPEVGQRVLVYDKSVRSVLVAELYIGSVTGCLGWTSDAAGVAIPTHWMPLPAPPAEGGTHGR